MLSLQCWEQKPPNSLLLQDKNFYSLAWGCTTDHRRRNPAVSTRMPGLEILACRQGLDPQRLQAFLAPLLPACAIMSQAPYPGLRPFTRGEQTTSSWS